MPTLIQLSGATYIPETVEGKSIWNVLSENDTINTKVYVRGHLQESIIQKPWKLIRTRHKDLESDFELYNVESDPEEKQNLVKDNPTVYLKMKSELEKQFAKDAKNVNLSKK